MSISSCPSGQYIAGASGLAGVVPTPPEPVELDVSGKTASGSVSFTQLGSGTRVEGELELSCSLVSRVVSWFTVVVA